MQAPALMFDIFRGKGPETNSLWVECVEGLEAAVDRMKVLATEKPGPYFVFQLGTHQVLSSIDSASNVQVAPA